MVHFDNYVDGHEHLQLLPPEAIIHGQSIRMWMNEYIEILYHAQIEITRHNMLDSYFRDYSNEYIF